VWQHIGSTQQTVGAAEMQSSTELARLGSLLQHAGFSSACDEMLLYPGVQRQQLLSWIVERWATSQIRHTHGRQS
jgi:hypothetical protein